MAGRPIIVLFGRGSMRSTGLEPENADEEGYLTAV
jgi:hypothetical protein